MRPKSWPLLAASLLSGAAVLPAGAAERAKSFDETHPDLPKDALQRRSRSNAVMIAEGVPVNEWLPVIESEGEVKRKSKEEILARATALTMLAMKATGVDQGELNRLINDHGVENAFTPRESGFIRNRDPSKAEKIEYSWRYEAAYVLFWALGYFEALDAPRAPCDPNQIEKIVRTFLPSHILAQSKLRSTSEVLDKADLIYRYRWALVEARVREKDPPAGLNDDIAMERHQALNWLVQDEEWDGITLDT